MYDERPQMSQWAPGWASKWGGGLVFAGILIALVGGTHEHDWTVIGIGCAVILAGGVVDTFARRGSTRLKILLSAVMVAASYYLWSNPHHTALLFQHIAAHAGHFITPTWKGPKP